jgi:hypothetical protein
MGHTLRSRRSARREKQQLLLRRRQLDELETALRLAASQLPKYTTFRAIWRYVSASCTRAGACVMA